MLIGASTLPKYDEGRHVASNVAQTMRRGREKAFGMGEASLHIYGRKMSDMKQPFLLLSSI